MPKKKTVQPKKAEQVESVPATFDFKDTIRMPANFKAITNTVTLRNLNDSSASKPSFYKYSKDDIRSYLEDPYRYSKNLRDASIYMYGASAHYRRIIQYFVGLTDLAYVVAPFKIDAAATKPESIEKKYKKTLNFLATMDIRNQFTKILTIVFREDSCYVTTHINNDSVTFQVLPSDYCDISSITNGVFNVSFNFSYFDGNNKKYLDFYPPEFTTKYNLYQNNKTTMKWQELDAPNSFAIKYSADIPTYPVPPLAPLLLPLADLSDYEALKLAKAELENYAMISMTIPTKDGEFDFDYTRAKEFWRNLDSVLPDEIGSVLTPMELEKISFERTHADDTSTVESAEQAVFTAAGVSSLLFNNAKASANALALSIKNDQTLTFNVVKSIEAVINRFIQAQSYARNFKVTMLDVSPYNRKEMGDQYLKACQYGVPLISYYCASQGMPQSDMDTMNFLEDDVLGLRERFMPLRSSAVTSGDGDSDVNSDKTINKVGKTDLDSPTDGEAGRPAMDDSEISESAERERERQ